MEDKSNHVVKAYVNDELYKLITEESEKTKISVSSLLTIAIVKLLEDYEYRPANFTQKRGAI
ncbi:glutathione-regulated potassium-efflux system protein KefC [Nostoc cycadae WK-1]|uniref:Glutathione-regulated potassium-efflux system protein KefC n=2 Tax=Nostoc cycadae TaxID=246795 RepID=A0A2H6LCB9_9NOSO|nr:glutathione-regulated potassium-efflux system protein KefC [Nostoc cycadae WK-1]